MSHKIELVGSKHYGYDSRLVCPDDCQEKEVHQECFKDVGIEILRPVDESIVLAKIEVIPEWEGHGEEAELWLNPVVYDED